MTMYDLRSWCVFWDVALCKPEIHWYFGRTCCHQLQSQRVSQMRTSKKQDASTLIPALNLKIKSICFSKQSVKLYQTTHTQCPILDDSIFKTVKCFYIHNLFPPDIMQQVSYIHIYINVWACTLLNNIN
jgi:hypothetical protein